MQDTIDTIPGERSMNVRKSAVSSAAKKAPAATPAAGAPRAARKSAAKPAAAPAGKPADPKPDTMPEVMPADANPAQDAATPDAPAPKKAKKPKLVRDNFTMPQSDYALLVELKSACLAAGFEAKKSQLLRVGLGLLKSMDMARLRREIEALAPVKPNRQKKSRGADGQQA
jgi:hypothetical protein